MASKPTTKDHVTIGNVFEEQGIRFSDWTISVPLFYPHTGKNDGKTGPSTLSDTAKRGLPSSLKSPNQEIFLYARILEEVAHISMEGDHKQPVDQSVACNEKRCLLYFEGGPGMSPPRTAVPFLKELARHYIVIVLDQRGTGYSSAVTDETLKDVGMEAQKEGIDRDFAIASYLTLFRADSIVEDADRLRRSLGLLQWNILGASFGGFCCLTYMSRYPGSLSGVLVSGGIPDISNTCSCEDVYSYNYQRLRRQNNLYYTKYPQDKERVKQIVRGLQMSPMKLPRGGRLSARRFLRFGVLLGVHGSSGVADLHRIVESAFSPQRRRIDSSKESFITYELNFQENYRLQENCLLRDTFSWKPLYHLLHESIYCSKSGHKTQWAAYRVENRQEFADFQVSNEGDFESDGYAYKASNEASSDSKGPCAKRRKLNDYQDESPEMLFTGEMTYPWDYEDYPVLFSLKNVANILAEWDDWPNLYEEDTLTTANIPLAAIVYSEDIFVPRELSEKTLEKLPHAAWEVIDSCDHSALGTHGTLVVSVLLSLLDRASGRIRPQLT